MTNEINKRLEEMAVDLQTKARLTAAEKLLLQCKAVIERQARQIDACNQAYGNGMDQMTDLLASYEKLENKLKLVPRWIRAIFDAD